MSWISLGLAVLLTSPVSLLATGMGAYQNMMERHPILTAAISVATPMGAIIRSD